MLKNWLLWILAIVIGWNLFGCSLFASRNTLDTTAAVKAVAKAGSHITYSYLPEDIDGNPDQRGTWLPAKPNTIVSLKRKTFYENGTVKSDTALESSPTPFVDALFAGANAADAQKYAEETKSWDRVERWIEKAIELAGPVVGKLVDRAMMPTVAPPQTGHVADVKALIQSALQDPDLDAALKAKILDILGSRGLSSPPPTAPPAHTPGTSMNVSPPATRVASTPPDVDRWASSGD